MEAVEERARATFAPAEPRSGAGAEFSMFNLLPFELRYAIWRESLPRRLVVLNPGKREKAQDCYTEHRLFPVLPAIAHVCSESRDIVYEHGARAYDLTGRPCFFDARTDFILVNDWPDEEDELAPVQDAIAEPLLSVAFRCPQKLVISEQLPRHKFASRCFERLSAIAGGIALNISNYSVPISGPEPCDIVLKMTEVATLVAGSVGSIRPPPPNAKIYQQMFEDQWLYACIAGGHPLDSFRRADTTVYMEGWNRDHPWVREKVACLPKIRDQVICVHLCPSTPERLQEQSCAVDASL